MKAYILYFVGSFCLVFLVAAFCNWSLDPGSWTVTARVITATIGIVLGILSVVLATLQEDFK
jgi:hypothetical protein